MPDNYAIDCPRASSWNSPCIARRGAKGVKDGVCYGCRRDPAELYAELAAAYTAETPSPFTGEHRSLLAQAADAISDPVHTPKQVRSRIVNALRALAREKTT